MTPDEILARLVEIAAQAEQHRAAAWLLDREADELRGQLRGSGWVSPAAPPKASP